VFAAYAQQVGYFLSRLEAATAVFDSEEQRLDLPTFLQARGPQMDLPVELGVHHHLPVRLLVVRVSAELANEWHWELVGQYLRHLAEIWAVSRAKKQEDSAGTEETLSPNGCPRKQSLS